MPVLVMRARAANFTSFPTPTLAIFAVGVTPAARLGYIAQSWRTSDDGSPADKLRYDRFAHITSTGFFSIICPAVIAVHLCGATFPFAEGHFMVFWISCSESD